MLALASGKRRGEIHTLTWEGLSWNHDKTIVCCRLDPTFISKTGIVMAPLVITALSHFVGGANPEELVLCHVRALLEYYENMSID